MDDLSLGIYTFSSYYTVWRSSRGKIYVTSGGKIVGFLGGRKKSTNSECINYNVNVHQSFVPAVSEANPRALRRLGNRSR